MKHRRMALVLAALLCAMSIFSCALLSLHANHVCSDPVCAVCMLLEQNENAGLSLPTIFVGFCLPVDLILRFLRTKMTDCFAMDATLVQRKVELLD